MFHPLLDFVLVINVLAKAVQPQTSTKPRGSVHIIVTTVPVLTSCVGHSPL